MKTRREFVTSLAYSAFGVSVLPHIKAETPKGKAEHVIYIYLEGGMSHLDSFDPKSNAEIKGPFDGIKTNVAGIEISSQLSRLAKHADKMCIVRGMSGQTGDHAGGQYIARTSYKKIGTITHPAMGAWMNKYQDDGKPKAFPLNYLISGPATHPGAGWMGSKYSPVPINDPLRGLENSVVKNKDEMNKRVEILERLNQQSNKIPNNAIRGYKEFYDQTIKLLNSKDLEAFDLSKESAATREKYGNSRIGNGLCLAKRLIEKTGAKFIEVSSGGWDNHVDIDRAMSANLNPMDQALDALLNDLKSSGLLSKTLIVIATEFGRTPTINVNKGRDHFPKAYSQALIGAGIKGGTVYGTTNEKGAEVMDEQMTVQNFNATIAAAIGLPIENKLISPEGRPFTVADKGTPVEKILA